MERGGGVVLILHSHSPFSQQMSVISTPFHFLPQYRISCQDFASTANFGESHLPNTGQFPLFNSQFPIPFVKYTFVCFILLFTSSSPCRKDQFAVSYFSTSLIVLIQVYNWEIRHHSLVCCCGLADIFYQFPYPVEEFPTLYFGQIPDPKNTPPDPAG